MKQGTFVIVLASILVCLLSSFSYLHVCILTGSIQFPLNANLSHRMTKPAKWPVRPWKTQISLGFCPVRSEPSLIRVLPVCLKKPWVLGYPLSTQWRNLIWLGGCPGWSESLPGTPYAVIFWFCNAVAHLFCEAYWHSVAPFMQRLS